MTNEEKDKKEYELALLLKSEEDLAGVIKLAGQHNAEGVSEPRAKRLQLSYEIKGHTEAVFVYFTFKMFGDDIKALEHDLNTQGERAPLHGDRFAGSGRAHRHLRHATA